MQRDGLALNLVVYDFKKNVIDFIVIWDVMKYKSMQYIFVLVVKCFKDEAGLG